MSSFGRLRLMVGFVVVAGLASLYRRHIISPQYCARLSLAARELCAYQKNLYPPFGSCTPINVLKDQGQTLLAVLRMTSNNAPPAHHADSVKILRKVSQSRTGLTAFSRNCRTDPCWKPPSDKLLRYCFPLIRMVDAKTCCTGPGAFFQASFPIEFKAEKQHSKTGFCRCSYFAVQDLFHVDYTDHRRAAGMAT